MLVLVGIVFAALSMIAAAIGGSSIPELSNEDSTGRPQSAEKLPQFIRGNATVATRRQITRRAELLPGSLRGDRNFLLNY